MTTQDIKQDKDRDKITVYYDGACPSCVRDRAMYEKLSGEQGKTVDWFDITGQEGHLCELGIDPSRAMKELHVKNEQGRIVSEMDAYIVLMQRTIWLRPLAWLLQLAIVRQPVSRVYHWAVHRRLSKTGRLS